MTIFFSCNTVTWKPAKSHPLPKRKTSSDKGFDLKLFFEIGNRMEILANLFIEAAMVGLVCLVFLILFVVAGIKQILNNKD